MMSKKDFLAQLRKELFSLPQEDIDERLSFYSEMIDDRIEEGFPEEQAVLAVGSVDEVVEQIISDISLAKNAKERIKSNRRLKEWEIILLILGCPIWISLGLAAVAVIISIYISLWSVIISLWSVFGSLIVSLFGSVVTAIIFACSGNVFTGMAMVGAGFVCAGLSVFMFYGCKLATKGILILTKKLAIWTKNCFVKKEVA